VREYDLSGSNRRAYSVLGPDGNYSAIPREFLEQIFI